MSSCAVTCFLLQKRSKGRGQRGSRELNMSPQPDHLLALAWFHRQGVNLRGPWKITCNYVLPPALSSSGFGITLCLFLTLCQRMEISQRPLLSGVR